MNFSPELSSISPASASRWTRRLPKKSFAGFPSPSSAVARSLRAVWRWALWIRYQSFSSWDSPCQMSSDLSISPEPLHCVSCNQLVYETADHTEAALYPFADSCLVLQWLHAEPSQQPCAVGSDVDGCSNLLGEPGLFKYLVERFQSTDSGSIACQVQISPGLHVLAFEGPGPWSNHRSPRQ